MGLWGSLADTMKARGGTTGQGVPSLVGPNIAYQMSHRQGVPSGPRRARPPERRSQLEKIARYMRVLLSLMAVLTSLSSGTDQPVCYAAYDYWSMCGPGGSLPRAGLAWDFIGPHGPRSAASDPRGTLPSS